jgi:hypothetical protein
MPLINQMQNAIQHQFKSLIKLQKPKNNDVTPNFYSKANREATIILTTNRLHTLSARHTEQSRTATTA